MQRIEIVVDGNRYETWVADESEATRERIRILEGAEAGSTIRLDIRSDELVSESTLVLRLGSASTVAIRVFPDDRTGAAMTISR
jgi:uncharacterized membrane protein